MMDASELYPEGFHPVRQNLSKNGMAEVVGVMRTHAPVRYYLIDFDSAIAFEKGTPIRYKYAEGKAGRDEEVPEFKLGEPYDPFKVDIFQFGNLLRKEFLQVCVSFHIIALQTFTLPSEIHGRGVSGAASPRNDTASSRGAPKRYLSPSSIQYGPQSPQPHSDANAS